MAKTNSCSSSTKEQVKETHQQTLLSIVKNLPCVLKLVWQTHPILSIVTIVCICISSMMPVALAWISKLIIDQIVLALSKHTALTALWSLIVLGVGINILNVLTTKGKESAQQLLQSRLGNRISVMVMEKSSSLDLSYFDDSAFHDLLQRSQNDINFRAVQLCSYLFSIIQDTITVLSLLILTLRFGPILVLVLVVLALPLFLVQVLYSREGYGIFERRSQDLRKMNYIRTLMTTQTSVKEVKLFDLADLFLKRFQRIFEDFYQENRRVLLRRTIAEAAMEILSVISYYGVYVIIIFQAIAGQITIGDVVMFTIVFIQLQETITHLVSELSGIYEQNLYMNNLFKFLALTPIQSLSVEKDRLLSFEPGITFDHVSFRYPNTEHEALRDICVHIPPGKSISLVGLNGAGKTTLIKLLTQLYAPTEGQIFVDGINLQTIDAQAWHKRLSVIFQDFVQYNFTVRDNIGFGCKEALEDPERIQKAAQQSGVDDVIASLPEGYDTMLGRMFSRGQELSGGQWQKLALARAFIHNADIVVLDEPTASLDAQTEYEIFQSFKALMAKRTTILISHRFSTARLADHIIVLQDGQIVAQGSHNELLSQEGLYATLFAMQATGYK